MLPPPRRNPINVHTPLAKIGWPYAQVDPQKVVPMVPHVDNNEHSVQILVTEQGLSDLRGLGHLERAEKIINTCAHPSCRPYLKAYLAKGTCGHICHDLTRCFELHSNFKEYGAMLPNL